MIEPLASNHVRKGFCCGRPRIDNFLLNNAPEHHARGQVRVFVKACDCGKVLGFYSLVCAAYVPPVMGPEANEIFSRVNAVPSIYLAHLGVDGPLQGAGLGRELMRDAFVRVLDVAENVGVYCLALDAATDELVPYYQTLGFQPFAEGERRMFIPVPTIREALS